MKEVLVPVPGIDVEELVTLDVIAELTEEELEEEFRQLSAADI